MQDLLGALPPNESCKISLIDPPDFQLNKFFYKQIGKNCRWIDRLKWNDKTWIEYVNNKNVKTYILKDKDELIGYFEQILSEQDSSIEIAYFGVLEEYIEKEGEVIGLMMYLGNPLELKEHLLIESKTKCLKMKEIAESTSNAFYECAKVNAIIKGGKIVKIKKIIEIL